MNADNKKETFRKFFRRLRGIFALGKRRTKQMSENERGFSLVEVIIAGFILLLIFAIGLKLTAWRESSQYDTETVKAAQDASFAAFNALGNRLRELPDGGSFEFAENYTIALNPCRVETCDYLLLPASGGDSFAQGIRWQSGYTAPADARIQFVRRWRKTLRNAELGLYDLTIAVLPDEQSTAPISLETKTIFVE